MIAILVPVLGRGHQIPALLESIAATTNSPYRVIFICSPEDAALKVAKKQKKSVSLTVVATWTPDRADYAKKLGLGVRSTNEPWLFQGATDLVFHPAWDVHAFKVHRRTNAGVIGTNDLGHKHVMAGLHATHSLISREYLDTWGGTFDDSGVIFSEAYDHQYTDNEFVATARARGQFAFSKRAIVEHMHPHWKKGEMDETYDKALRETKQDHRLFARRHQRMMQAEARRARA